MIASSVVPPICHVHTWAKEDLFFVTRYTYMLILILKATKVHKVKAEVTSSLSVERDINNTD